MYELVSGPLVWIAFIGLVGGSIYKLASMAALAKKEKTVYPTMNMTFGLRSVFHWVVPYNSRNMQLHPVMTLVSFAFHICLLITPLFVMGHAVLWYDAWKIRWWSLKPELADIMTLVVILSCLFFILRRIALPEVRNVTTWKDFLLIIIVASPFLTGYIAYHQWLPYEATIILHIVCGVIWMLAIPVTWLAHMLWFIFARAYMGSEFGWVRNSRDW